MKYQDQKRVEAYSRRMVFVDLACFRHCTGWSTGEEMAILGFFLDTRNRSNRFVDFIQTRCKAKRSSKNKQTDLLDFTLLLEKHLRRKQWRKKEKVVLAMNDWEV